MKILGIDIGGTTIKAAIVLENGTIQFKMTLPTSNNLLGQVLETISAFESKCSFDAIGIGAAGRVDPANGSVVLATDNLSNWSGVPLRQLLEERTGLKIFVINDSNAAAYGEWILNHGRTASFVMITVGTGLGGGVVVEGKLLLGKRGEAGEFGHIVIHPGGRKCNCGKCGCAEQYASMKCIHTAVLRRARRDIGRTELIQDFVRKDPDVTEAVSEILSDLALLIDSVFLVLDPDIVAIGGGISELGETLIDMLQKEIAPMARASLYSEEDVILASSRNDAGIVGAALYALDNMRSHPS